MNTARIMPAALILLIAVASGAGGAEWYASNAVGTRGAAVDASRAASLEYALEVTFRDGLEVRRLLHDGVEVGRTDVRREGARTIETEFRDGHLAARRVLGAGELLLEEVSYVDGEPTETRAYAYLGGRLERRTIVGANGSVAVETYRYWADGTLRSVSREDPVSVVEYRYDRGRLTEEWSLKGEEREHTRYDRAGRVVERRSWQADRLVREEFREYWGPEAGAAVRRVTQTADGQTETRRYSETGTLLETEVTVGGVVRSDRRRVVIDGLLVEEIEVREGIEYRSQYGYDGQRLVRELHLTAGVRSREVAYLGSFDLERVPEGVSDRGVDRVETVYRDGEEVLRVYYSGLQRVFEEVVRDGEVIRTRSLSVQESAP